MKTDTPTLFIDEEKCRRNIRQMAQKAANNRVSFRPHFKTHQSAVIGEWFREEGVGGITVSSVSMAAYFADHGWEDVTVAVPCNIREIEAINTLAGQIRLNLLVESPETARFLQTHLTHTVGLYVEIDTGQHRTGVAPEDTHTQREILQVIRSADRLSPRGFYSHPGHTYHANSPGQIVTFQRRAIKALVELRARYASEFPDLRICIGDTPGCSLNDNLRPADEVSPGNFVFYDAMQQHLGACSWDQIAVAAACPVIATYPERNEVVIYGGAIHLSKDSLALDEGITSYGAIVEIGDGHWGRPWNGAFVRAISQEHGVVRLLAEQARNLRVGDVLGILPVHSCLTANLFREYRTPAGEVISMM